ncbi:MAG: class I SAM-dependent methyltransferase [Steroidobacteraceae bacterium]
MEPNGKRIVPPNMTLAPSVSALPGVSATMLVTLAAKALAATDAPEIRYRGRRSTEILRELDVDPRSFNLNPSEVRAVVLRSQWFGQTVRRFLERHPDGLCINLGCGLDPSFEDLEEASDGRFTWIDVDLPAVIAIRRRFFAESTRRRIIAGDVTDSQLFASIPWDTGRPAIVVAEGVLFFLQRAQVESLFRAQADAADLRRAEVEIAFDYASPFGAWIVTRRPAHRQLGTTFSWTVHNPTELRRVDPQLEVLEDSNVFLDAMGTGARQLDALYHLVSGSSLGGCAHLRRTAAA